MKATFPYMGTTIVYKKLLELLGHEVICPPKPTQRTIDLGVKHSPEFACFPYKVIMGSYIEGLEMGADTIVTSAGNGPCRAGFYIEAHRKTLESLGYDFDVVYFDEYKRNKELFMENVRKLKANNSWWDVLKHIWTVYKLSCALDDMLKYVESHRPYEKVKGSLTKVFDAINKDFEQRIFTARDVKREFNKAMAQLKAVEVRDVPEVDKIRLIIVGEIYVVMEDSINMNIPEVLNELGCEVTRSLYLSEWIDHNIMPKFIARTSDQEVLRKGKRYCEIGIGGHEQHTIGSVIHYKELGYDGAIHLMPFACLPELVSQSILPRIAKDLDMPALTLAIDEQTGMAHNLTRVEAFIDLLRDRKRKQQLRKVVQQ